MAKVSVTEYKKNLSAILNQVASDCSTPIVIVGADAFLKQKALEKIKRKWQQISPAASIVAYEASEVSDSDFLNLWESPDLFSEKSMFVLRRCEKKPGLIENLKRLTPSQQCNQLILMFENERIAAAIQKEIKRLNGTVLECPIPATFEVPGLVRDMTSDIGILLSPEALKFILDTLGNDLFLIENELSKASYIHSGNSAPLTDSDLTKFLEFMKEEHAFRLSDYLLNGQLSHAQALLSDLLRRGESPLALLGILARHCRNAILCSNETPASSRPRLPNSIQRRYNYYYRKKSPTALAEAMTLIHEADLSLKSGYCDEEMVLTKIIDSL